MHNPADNPGEVHAHEPVPDHTFERVVRQATPPAARPSTRYDRWSDAADARLPCRPKDQVYVYHLPADADGPEEIAVQVPKRALADSMAAGVRWLVLTCEVARVVVARGGHTDGARVYLDFDLAGRPVALHATAGARDGDHLEAPAYLRLAFDAHHGITLLTKLRMAMEGLVPGVALAPSTL